MSTDLSSGLSKETPLFEDAPWVSVALADLGIGNDSPANVRRYLQTVRAPLLDENGAVTNWCSAFVNSCMERAGVRGLRTAAAPAWMTWGHEVSSPRFGNVAVFSRIVGNDTKTFGHVGFFIRNSGPNHMVILGGNQSKPGTVSFSSFPIKGEKYRLLGFRRPISFQAPPVLGSWA